MMPWPRQASEGFVLLAVVLALSLVAALAFLMAREGAIEAGMVVASAQADAAHYVAEAGLQHAGWLANQASCAGYSDLAATAFGAHSYSASVTPSAGSPIAIEATGTHADGATRTLRREDVGVLQTGIGSLVLQPGSEGKDAWINSTFERNNGAHQSLSVNDASHRTLIEFDVSSLPEGVVVVAAELGLWVKNNNASGLVDLHRVTQPWVEGTKIGSGSPDGVTWKKYDGSNNWTTPGGDHEATPVATASVSSVGAWVSWDVTTLVASWASGAPNLGMLLIGDADLGSTDFVGSDHAESVHRPRLTLTYACPCPSAPTTLILQPGSEGKDVYIDSANDIKNYGASGNFKLDNNDQRGLLWFDLSPIPPDSNVTAAQLELYLDKVGATKAGEVTVHRLTRSWEEGTLAGSAPADGATWTSYDGTSPWAPPGGEYDATVESSSNVGDKEGYYGWDVTDLVQDWVDGSQANDGMLLRRTTVTGSSTFLSSDTNTPKERPKLSVSYVLLCAPPGGGDPVTETLPADADSHLVSASSDKNFGGAEQLQLGDGDANRPVLRFDTSGIPAGALVQNATLRLYVTNVAGGGPGYAIGAYKLTEDWSEGSGDGSGPGGQPDVTWLNRMTATLWATAGGSFQTPAVDSLALPGPFNSGWTEYDLTPLVQEWVDGASPNAGVILTTTTSKLIDMNSRENATVSLRPELVVTYAP